ncbi:MAG: hypothetical protein M1833_000337 [Piccolia ochrophora]|nr:MAG: hypothetical protein M1833_000337 [Piccolia ochrophora]
MAGLPFLPRSPRWLAKVGRIEEATLILAKIQAGGNVDDPHVVAEWEEITTVLAAERQARKGWRKFFYDGMWRRTLAGMSVQAWQQLSGANVMTYYIVYVFGMAGLTGNVNLVSSGVQYALFIIFTSAVFFFIDKTGRRPLLIYGALGMAVCHFVVGGILGSYGEDVPEGVDGNLNVIIRVTGAPSHTVIAFSYLLIIIYALTLAPVAWIYAAEVWSLETRAVGMSLAAVANWLFNFALGLFVPPAFGNISWKTFIIFGVLCVAAAVQAFFTYPETAQKSLEEIEILFSHEGPRPWKTRPGDSLLDRKISQVQNAKEQGESRHVDFPMEKA